MKRSPWRQLDVKSSYGFAEICSRYWVSFNQTARCWRRIMVVWWICGRILGRIDFGNAWRVCSIRKYPALARTTERHKRRYSPPDIICQSLVDTSWKCRKNASGPYGSRSDAEAWRKLNWSVNLMVHHQMIVDETFECRSWNIGHGIAERRASTYRNKVKVTWLPKR